MALDPGAVRTLIYAGLVLALILAIRIRGSVAIFKALFPLRFAPPAAADLVATPGVDAAFLEQGAQRLKGLGYRHLLDYELPSGSPRLRYFYSSYLSADGKTVASLAQRFATTFAHDYVVFTSWFASGHRVVTSSSPIVAPEINPQVHQVPMPDCRDFRELSRRHESAAERLAGKGHERVTLAGVEDLRRLLLEGRERDSRVLADAGYVRIEGDHARATGKMAAAILSNGFWPIRRGVSLEGHLWRIGGPAAVVGILLPLLVRSHAAPLKESCLVAGAVLGGCFGYGLWHHALFWSLLVPALLVGGLTGSVEMSAAAVLGSLALSQIGFQFSAARAQARGRRALASK
jgi:hypothetical protein